MPSSMMTLREVMEDLRISRSQVYRLIAERKLPPAINKRWLRVEIEAYVVTLRWQARPAPEEIFPSPEVPDRPPEPNPRKRGK